MFGFPGSNSPTEFPEMRRCAKDGTALEELVRIATPLCQRAEKLCPRTGPGRRPEIPDWTLAVMIMVAIMRRKKSKSSQYAYWQSRQEDFARWFPDIRFPARSTFFDRYRRIHRVFQAAIRLQGQKAIARGWADARCVAIDKSLIAGRGRPWGPGLRRQGILPRRVDRDTTWGYSRHDGWVQGYAYEIVVTAAKQGVVWPMLASVDTASRSEQKTVLAKIPLLPRQTRFALADSGYDSNAVAEAVEGKKDRRRRRRFLCPEVPRPNNEHPCQQPRKQSRLRQWHRRRRDERRRFFQSRRGRKLYARRKVRVEPFNERLKGLFDLDERVWHWGLDNNRTQILAAIFAYQTLLTYNHRRLKHNAHVKRTLDGL
jgi:hypothetical protein